MKNIFKRSKLNPILEANPKNPLESKKVYNPGVIYDGGEYYLYYRAVGDDGISCIRLATSKDGENFVKQEETIIAPKQKFERRGAEDPRIQKVGSKYIMTYTAYDGKNASLAWAKSKNLYDFKKQGRMFSDWKPKESGSFDVAWDTAQLAKAVNKKWSKAGGIFSRKMGGRYWMLFGDRQIWLASSRFGKKWVPNKAPFIRPRDGYFDSVHVEMGPPPIETSEGWLVLYHGIDEQAVYRLGVLLLDLDNPMGIIKRSDKAIFEPSLEYELDGDVDVAQTKDSVPKVVFCNGAVLEDKKLRIFYGAEDSVIGTAVGKLKDII